MVRALLLLLLLLLSDASDADARIELAQLHIEQRVIIRVPLAIPLPPMPSRPPVALRVDPPPTGWREKKGQRCLKMKDVIGYHIRDVSSIDMVTTDGKRYRATLERGCTSTDFYSDFYMAPTRDGALCVKRDAIQARNGAACKVQEFRRMVPRK